MGRAVWEFVVGKEKCKMCGSGACAPVLSLGHSVGPNTWCGAASATYRWLEWCAALRQAARRPFTRPVSRCAFGSRHAAPDSTSAPENGRRPQSPRRPTRLVRPDAPDAPAPQTTTAPVQVSARSQLTFRPLLLLTTHRPPSLLKLPSA